MNASWQAGMKDGYWLGKDHPGVYLGERQALNEDYTHSGFDRGHLNPNGHHPGTREREETFPDQNLCSCRAQLPSYLPLGQGGTHWLVTQSGSVRTLRQDLSIGFISDVFRI